ncbi:hypothetical protein CUMW_278360 [Citrus unshiu]|uniref:Uncharacterized protein n=1 Tax=Citrus unshiu TaxID=55188 RepID=A0A2H5N550_CITUN|nr:hypothetical protein CUMW_278360 [Citrus unshiu]
MDSDFGIPRELSGLQQLRSLYQPELPPCLQFVILCKLNLTEENERQVENFNDEIITWGEVMLLRQMQQDSCWTTSTGNPGPVQFDGPGADAKACNSTRDYMGRIKELQKYLDEVRTIVKPGCSQEGNYCPGGILDSTTNADPADTHSIRPILSSNTYGQPLAHFLRATAKRTECGGELFFCGNSSPGGHNVVGPLRCSQGLPPTLRSTLLGFFWVFGVYCTENSGRSQKEIFSTYQKSSVDLLKAVLC